MTILNANSRRPTTGAATHHHANDWRTRGICRDEDPDLFFPEGPRNATRVREREAQQVCLHCPVMEACRNWALSKGVEAGVWGGLTPRDRRAIWRGQGRATATQAVEAWAMDPDPVAVHAYLTGALSDVEDVDRIAAIGAGVRDGMTYQAFDDRHGLPRGTTSQFVRQMRQAFEEAGYEFPFASVPVSVQRAFTDGQARQVRERFAAGLVTVSGLVEELGVNRKTVMSLLTGVSYRKAGGPVQDPQALKAMPVPAGRLGAQDMGAAA